MEIEPAARVWRRVGAGTEPRQNVAKSWSTPFTTCTPITVIPSTRSCEQNLWVALLPLALMAFVVLGFVASVWTILVAK